MTSRYLINLAAVADLARILIPAARAAAKDAPTLEAYDLPSRLVAGLEDTLKAVREILHGTSPITAPQAGAPASAGPADRGCGVSPQASIHDTIRERTVI